MRYDWAESGAADEGGGCLQGVAEEEGGGCVAVVGEEVAVGG